MASVICQLFNGTFFDYNALKRLIISLDYAFRSYIPRSVQPYFQPLKPTLQRLCTMLREAYRQGTWDNIHNDTLKILTDAETSVVNYLSTLSKEDKEES